MFWLVYVVGWQQKKHWFDIVEGNKVGWENLGQLADIVASRVWTTLKENKMVEMVGRWMGRQWAT